MVHREPGEQKKGTSRVVWWLEKGVPILLFLDGVGGQRLCCPLKCLALFERTTPDEKAYTERWHPPTKKTTNSIQPQERVFEIVLRCLDEPLPVASPSERREV
jgi:hypothetical protein